MIARHVNIKSTLNITSPLCQAAVVNGRVLGSDQEGDEERWSVKVDLQSSVDDFNERVPNLAHEVTDRESGPCCH